MPWKWWTTWVFRYIIFPFTDVVHWLLLNFDSFPSFRSIHLLWCAFLSTPMLSRVIRYPTEEISYPFYPVLSDQSWWSLSMKLYFLIQNNRCQPLTKKWLIRAKVFFLFSIRTSGILKETGHHRLQFHFLVSDNWRISASRSFDDFLFSHSFLYFSSFIFWGVLFEGGSSPISWSLSFPECFFLFHGPRPRE